jgi:hypothetical protein
MRSSLRTALLAAIMLVVVVLLAAMPAAAQTGSSGVPRTANGHPDLNGIWEAVGTADWDLEDHSAHPGPMWQLGAIGAEPAGMGVVEGKAIPYKPSALEKKKENFANRLTEDPEAKCYMPGVPRATYLPFPFHIVQTPTDILMIYEYATANRLINMGKPEEAAADSWMGTSNGHWDGDTLVVDVTGLNGKAWLDRAGDFGSENLHVVERYTFRDKDHILYQATLDDPSLFARPWAIRLPLYRRVEQNAQLLEFKCVPFAEEILYGKFRKKQPGK